MKTFVFDSIIYVTIRRKASTFTSSCTTKERKEEKTNVNKLSLKASSKAHVYSGEKSWKCWMEREKIFWWPTPMHGAYNSNYKRHLRHASELEENIIHSEYWISCCQLWIALIAFVFLFFPLLKNAPLLHLQWFEFHFECNDFRVVLRCLAIINV